MSAETRNRCKNLYRFIRLRLGDEISDREIARRWPMEWKSFNALRHGRRQVPRIAELESLACLLAVHSVFVFEVARGVSAERVHELLARNDPKELFNLLTAGVLEARVDAERKETSYRALLDRIHDGIFSIDVQGVIQDMNRGLCVITGRSKDELFGKSFFELLPSNQRPKLVETAAEVYREGEKRGLELVFISKEGSEQCVELSFTRIESADGIPIGIQGIVRDIDEQKRLDEERRQQFETLKATFDSVPAACILFGKDGTILLANRLIDNVCEWTAEEIIGKNAFEVFGNPGPEGCPVTRSFLTGKPEQQISRVLNRKHEEVYVHRTAGPVRSARGEVDRVVEIMVDVTEGLAKQNPQLLALWNERGQVLASDPRFFGIEKRRFLRLPLRGTVQIVGRSFHQRATVHNIGCGGAFVRCGRVNVAEGTEIVLELTAKRPMKLRGVVAWKSSSSTTPRGVGIRFLPLSEEQREDLFVFMKLSRNNAGRIGKARATVTRPLKPKGKEHR